MGMRMPEICWAVSKRQVINLWSCCIFFVDSVENMGINSLTGELNWRKGPTAKVSRKRSLSQNRSPGMFHPNIIIPCPSSIAYDTASWKGQLRSVVVCRVRSKMSPCSCLDAGDILCYDLLNKVQSYFSNHEGFDDREVGFSAWNTNGTSSASCCLLSLLLVHRHTSLKLHIIWRKRAKNIKFCKNGRRVKVISLSGIK